MYFLNSGAGFSLFEEEALKEFYIDKSLMIDTLYKYVRKNNKFVCITRPRRFGKSVCANMVAAFFEEGTAEKSRDFFSGLEIGRLREEQERIEEDRRNPQCWKHQGRRKVIHINFNDVLNEKVDTYEKFCATFRSMLLSDIKEAYPLLNVDEDKSISEILLKTGEKYIFIIDEWDAIFEQYYITEKDRVKYILLLKALLKDKKYIDFVYMTGILPIAKYSSGSPLNMFSEFTSFQDNIFYPWFGLTKNEIQRVMGKNRTSAPKIDDLAVWYDGYVRSFDGEHVYNPTSVSAALAEGICQSHWTKTGPMNEVRNTILHNIQEVREDIIRMVGGETLEVKLNGFSVEEIRISSKDEILSSMVVYGFLTYYDEHLSIPNHELMLKFQEALASEEIGLKQTIEESKRLLRATLDRRHNEVAKCLEELHDEKIPFFNYNDENSLACVVTIGYLAAIDKYRISREDKAGKGYADFIFEPRKKDETAIILELKYNHSAKNAIKSIYERDYIKRLKDYKRVLLVGINYSEKTKKHTCLTELMVRN